MSWATSLVLTAIVICALAVTIITLVIWRLGRPPERVLVRECALMTVPERLDYYTSGMYREPGACQTERISLAWVRRVHAHEFERESWWSTLCINFDQLWMLRHLNKSIMSTQTPVVLIPSGSYVMDLSCAWEGLPDQYKTETRRLLWYPRDRVEPFTVPCLVKTRCARTAPKGSILFKLNRIRHFVHLERLHRDGDPVHWSAKKGAVLWRGRATGYGFGNNIPKRDASREELVRRWIGASTHLVNVKLVGKDDNENHMSIHEMLEYKYLLSVEGNDVASNLKWIMASNSVPFMPRPVIASWFMEDRLKPWVHFVPVRDDFGDLEKQVIWAENHQDHCRRIVDANHAWVAQFTDQDREMMLQRDILKWYLDTFTLV